MDTLFNTTDERGASKRRGIVAALAAAAMLVPLAFAPSATAAEGDYSGGIKGEYNALGIAAGVATEAYSGLNSQERQDTVLANFNQITPENSMKPEGWYDKIEEPYRKKYLKQMPYIPKSGRKSPERERWEAEREQRFEETLKRQQEMFAAIYGK